MAAAAKAHCSALGEGEATPLPHVAVPCFPAIESTPLGNVPDKGLVLHGDWQMREEAICGDHGASFSTAGFTGADSWYQTTVPTTTLGTLTRNGVYPDPYIGVNNMLIPDACPEHNELYGLGGYSHLPNHENPWAKPYWFRTEFNLPADFKRKVVWLHLDGINYRARCVGQRHADWRPRESRRDVPEIPLQCFRRHASRHSANAIAVRIHPLDKPGDPIDEQLGGIKEDSDRMAATVKSRAM